MKMFDLYILTIITSLLWGACDKRDTVLLPDPPAKEQDTVFELIWATRLNFEKEIVGTDNTLQYKNWMLAGGDLDDPPTIMAFNKETGEKEWELVLDQVQGGSIDFMFRHENILLARNGYTVFAVNLDSKELIWAENLKSMGLRPGRCVIAKNGKFYQTAVFNFDPLGGGVQKLYEFDPLTGENRMILSLAPDSIGTKTISPPTIWEDVENNRTIMIFNLFPNAEIPPGQGDSQELVAIDLATTEVIWNSRVTNNFYSNSLHPPIVYDNRIVITGGDWSIYAFDINTGEQLWRYKFNYPWAIWTKTNHLIHGNRLYVNNSQEDVTCLNPETGELIWNNPKGGANCTDNMIYCEKEDLLVFTSWGYGSVMVLDALTGETLHREHRFDNSSYNSDVVYDADRDMFFTSTYKHAIGFKVHRPK